MITVNVKSN